MSALLSGLASAPSALAIGIGPVPESIAYGRPLDLTVPLRLDRGDATPPGCLQVEVLAGGQRMPPGYLHVTLEGPVPAPGEGRIRVRSDLPVQEPVLTLRLSAGCAGPVSRQFVLFADPGGGAADAGASGGAAGPAPDVDAAAGVIAAAAQGAGRGGAAAVQRAQRRAADAPAPQPASPVAAEVPPAAPASRPKPPAADASVPATLWSQLSASAPPPTTALAAVAAPGEAQGRLAALEGELQALRADADLHRAAAQQMRSRLAEVDQRGATQGLLMTLVGILGLSVVALGWRVRRLRSDAAAPAAAASPGVAAGATDAAVGAMTDFGRGQVALLRTQAPGLDEAALAGDGMPRKAPAADPEPELQGPVDELIDLEQEAEFFTLLGDDAAAIDLLERNIRRRGITSPLPYLKQLDLHRQLGAREAFDRAARRFGSHFAADAPRWEAAGDDGLGLQDHASAVAELQSLWPDPARALECIEAMLFPGPRGTLFGLSAYADLLTLHQVARELRRMPASDPAGVDLHLPLAEDDALAVMLSPSIFDTLATGAATAPMPTARSRAGAGAAGVDLDLDLSEPAMLDAPAGPASAARGD